MDFLTDLVIEDPPMKTFQAISKIATEEAPDKRSNIIRVTDSLIGARIESSANGIESKNNSFGDIPFEG